MKKIGQKQMYYVGYSLGATVGMLRNMKTDYGIIFTLKKTKKHFFKTEIILEIIYISYNYLEHTDNPKRNTFKCQWYLFYYRI